MIFSALPGNPASPGALFYGVRPVSRPALDASARDALPSTLDRQSTSNGVSEGEKEAKSRNSNILLAVGVGILIYAIWRN